MQKVICWKLTIAKKWLVIVAAEGIELTQKHWDVINICASNIVKGLNTEPNMLKGAGILA
jgi:sulfur relay (sulfurtransferase) DsrC/TusE family protein